MKFDLHNAIKLNPIPLIILVLILINKQVQPAKHSHKPKFDKTATESSR